MPSALATICLCALPCGRSFSASFSTAARSVSDVVLRSFAARSQKGSSRHQELSPLPAQRSRQTNETDFDHEAVGSCSQFHAGSLVSDPGIPSKERQGFAEVFRRRGDIDEDPRIAWIGPLGQVQTESGVLDRFRGPIEEPACPAAEMR